MDPFHISRFGCGIKEEQGNLHSCCIEVQWETIANIIAVLSNSKIKIKKYPRFYNFTKEETIEGVIMAEEC